MEITGGDMNKKSKDKIAGNGGRELIDKIYERGWYILNGRTKGDWDGGIYICWCKRIFGD